MGFDAFDFHTHVLAGIRRAGYARPTPVQAQAIPPILAGSDLLGVAQTGTGKTAAYALPILQRLVGTPRRGSRVLVIVPTRELADQIHGSFTQLGRKVGVQSTPVYGGVGMQPQIDRLRNGKDIVVACPGRLLDHLVRGTVDLSGVETLVLDEADRMFDLGFLPDLRRIVARLPKRRQTLLFTATMPEEVRALTKAVLHDPAVVRVGEETPPPTIAHRLYSDDRRGKTELLLRLLHHTTTRSVLVFTQTRDRARRLAETLGKAGHRAACLQAGLSQGRRQAALDGFRDGTHQILVATDIAARGLDVPSVSHVVHYDLPATVEDYTHRTGRTGRACRQGTAISLATLDDQAMVRAIEANLGAPLERPAPPPPLPTARRGSGDRKPPAGRREGRGRRRAGNRSR